MKCKDCRYAVKEFQAGAGNYFCKYNPPVPVLIPSPGGMSSGSLWPVVTENDFCSRYGPKEY